MAKQQRSYILTIQDKDKNWVTIEPPFTIDFDVTRNPYCGNVIGQIRVYNLKQETRNRILRTQYVEWIPIQCELKAGYGIDLHTIIVGNVRVCHSRREGVNYITTIEIISGTYAAVNSVTQITVGKGKTKQDIVDELITKLPGIRSKVLGRNYQGNFSSRALVLSGRTVALLKELTDGQFFIDNDIAYQISDGECVSGIVNVIESESGLVGSPQLEGARISFTMIFEPRILMFQIIALKSTTESQFNGQFKVISFRHYGTISETVAGQAMTEIQVLRPNELLKLLTGTII